jgi:hypothetical protein
MDYTHTYAKNWKDKSYRAKQKTDFHCCLCNQQHRYLESHHVVYCNKKKRAIAGYEKVGVHIFPLCKQCHQIAHSPENWIQEADPKHNRNTTKFYRKLCKNYKAIQKTIKSRTKPIPQKKLCKVL